MHRSGCEAPSIPAAQRRRHNHGRAGIGSQRGPAHQRQRGQGGRTERQSDCRWCRTQRSTLSGRSTTAAKCLTSACMTRWGSRHSSSTQAAPQSRKQGNRLSKDLCTRGKAGTGMADIGAVRSWEVHVIMQDDKIGSQSLASCVKAAS